jgi:ABC-type uncharacterized transport system substrate-binding protein
MLKTLRGVWLGLLLIASASALLLYSDLDRRQSGPRRPAARSLPRLAVMQWSSTDLLDHTVQGMVEGLRLEGFEHGRSADIRFLNASGDNTTGNVMARDLADGQYRMILTASTLALQAMAKANAQGRVVHLFGAVTDPYGAGVGITGPGAGQHPPHLVGVGTFQPVERAIRLARQIQPALRRIGTVWNPGESNSEACLKKARAICKELGIDLIEANAGSTSEVPEAVRSVLARDAQALWVGGDIVAIASMGAIVAAAHGTKVPVFTNDPSDAARGALFGVGASYKQVGIAVGEMAGKILKGAEPSSFGVENLVPEVLAVNERVAKDLGTWTFPEDVLAQARAAASPVVAAPASATASPVVAAPASGTPWKIRVVRYNDAQFSADTFRGILDGLKKQDLQEGRDFNLRCLNAQGDMTTLTSIMTGIRAEEPHLVFAISTPALQAALRQLGRLPIVFASVGDAVRSGAGRSETDHLPNITGITTRSPFEAMARLIKESVPGVKAVGTLFTPSEINSELYREWFAEALKKEGLELVAVPVNASADTSEGMIALLRSPIQVVGQIADNATRPGFSQIARRARDVKLPVFCFDTSEMADGAALALARDYYETGVEAAAVAARVLRGTPPKDIPFSNTHTETLAINPDLMRQYGIVLSLENAAKAKVLTAPKP